MAMVNKLKYTVARYTGFKFLVDFQFKALGFRTCGRQVDDVTDGYTTTFDFDAKTANSTRNHHIEKYAYYMRHVAYPTNPLLEVTRFLLWILRIVRKLCAVAFPIAIFLALLGQEELQTPLAVVAVVYALSWCASIAFVILAVLIRRLFSMDARMDEICLRNGWQKYSDYPNT